MSVELSVVVPVCNESDNVAPLVQEIRQALAGRAFEMLFVDDGSTDATTARLLDCRVPDNHDLRILRHSRRAGQSAALANGVRESRGSWIATLDGDGQNDPADIAKLLQARELPQNTQVRLFIGNRTTRRDTRFRRLQSRIANAMRSRMLGDGTPDTGCGLKLFERSAFMQLPCFDHMHLFLPALFQRQGYAVLSLAVQHRARVHGTSKYGMFDRLWVGIVDLLGVMWLRKRYRPGLEVNEL
jgi:dolichol-phosphate mannosyltransferase